MTGIEAISNAVPAFRPVEWRNARITLSWMVGLLIAMFGGVLAVAKLSGVVPQASQTMLSQLAHLGFGDGPVYILIQAATAAVLLLAANTAYNDFPRVMFLMARDRLAPRSFLQIGDRLTFSTGIVVLSVVSAVIYIGFSGNTNTLLPLYAVGVFLAFTLSQAGMVVHWRRHRDDPHWRRSLVFNATGAVLSGIVFLIAGVTKFTAGAWVAIILIALIVVTALLIHRYYDMAGQQLALRPEDVTKPGLDDEAAQNPGQVSNLLVVPVAVIDRSAMRALAYAAALGQPVLVVHVSPTTDEASRFRGYWQAWGDHLPLEVIVSPHRALVAPLVNYVWTLHEQRPDLTLTVIVPELVTRHWWHQILHEHVASRLRRALRAQLGMVVTSAPFHLTG